MFPTLGQVGPLELSSLPVFTAVGILIALLLVAWWAPKEGLRPHEAINFCLLISLLLFIGGKTGYAVTDYRQVANKISQPTGFWLDGVSVPAGLLLASIGCITYLKSRHLSIWQIGDLLAPGYVVADIGYRIGCFLDGSAFGLMDPELPWGVSFPATNTSARPIGVSLHPTQLYYALGLFMLLALLLLGRRFRIFRGFPLLLFALLYPILLVVVWPFRGDIISPDPVIGSLPLSLTIGLVIAALSGITLGYRAIKFT